MLAWVREQETQQVSVVVAYVRNKAGPMNFYFTKATVHENVARRPLASTVVRVLLQRGYVLEKQPALCAAVSGHFRVGLHTHHVLVSVAVSLQAKGASFLLKKLQTR